MTSTRNQRAVGIFSDRPTTASALQALQDARFSRRQLTVIARDAKHQSAIAGVPIHSHIGNRAGQGAAAGAFSLGILGGAAGLATGLGLIAIPGLAPLIGMAPGLLVGESAGILAALTGAIAGATTGGLVGALIGLGIPANRARQYRDRVEQGDYLVLLKGTPHDIQRAETLLQQQGIQDFGVYTTPPTSRDLRLDSQTDMPVMRALESPIPAKPMTATEVQPAGVPMPGAATLLQLDPTASPVAPVPPPEDSLPPRTAQVIPPSRPSRESHRELSQRDSVRSAYPEKRLIGIFASAEMMEAALNTLKNARFPMHKLSVVVRETDSIPQLDDTSTPVAPANSTLGGITGLMVGVHRLNSPGQGQFLVIGADAPSLTRTQSTSHSADLVQSLMSLGIAEADARLYSDRLSQGASLITVRGVGGETLHATSILSQHGLQSWCIYDVRDTALSKGLN